MEPGAADRLDLEWSMRAQVLYQDKAVTLARYDHSPAVPHLDPDAEESEAYAVSFIERGSFHLHRGREAWRLSQPCLFVTRPGFRYRCTHESAMPDDVCLSIRVSPDLVAHAASQAERGWDDVIPVAPLTNRLAYLHRQLGEAVADGMAPMSVPALATEVLAAVLRPGAAPRLHRAGQLAWYAERIDAARRLMESRFAEPLTIEALGREVGISTFHFCRVFRELVGVPPHRYLVQVRLARGAEALRQGASVTAASRDAGFVSLPHFVRQFRRAHGVTPSRYRRAAAK